MLNNKELFSNASYRHNLFRFTPAQQKGITFKIIPLKTLAVNYFLLTLLFAAVIFMRIRGNNRVT